MENQNRRIKKTIAQQFVYCIAPFGMLRQHTVALGEMTLAGRKYHVLRKAKHFVSPHFSQWSKDTKLFLTPVGIASIAQANTSQLALKRIFKDSSFVQTNDISYLRLSKTRLNF